MQTLEASVLVVHDQALIRDLVSSALSARGYNVIQAELQKLAMESLWRGPDLVLLGARSLDGSELEFLRYLRDSGFHIPVVVLSCVADEKVKLFAFELGADDYLISPFSTEELLARIRVALRNRSSEQKPSPSFVVDGLTVDFVKRLVKVNGENANLSPKEYDILCILAQHAGKVVTSALLLKRIWQVETDPQYIRTYMRQLRKKIESDPSKPRYITTVSRVGYRLKAPE